MTFKNLNAAIGPPKPPRSPAPVKPTVVLQPTVYREMQKGINLIAEAIRPTLGPFPRLVALEKTLRDQAPEFLDDASVIARRIIQVKPRTRDVGAMLLRKALWQMHEEVGDGSATMGVLFQRIFNEGVRCVTEFGSNPMLLRQGLDKGLKAVLQELRSQAVPLRGKENIARIAAGMTQGDEEMASLLGEIFDIVGKDGLIVVEKGNRPGLEREYIEGTYWHISGYFSRLFINEPRDKRVTYEDAALLITDMELKDPLHLVPVLERCVQAGIQKLVIISAGISDACIGLLEQNRKKRTIEAMAVRTPRTGETQRVAAIEDIAILTGGQPFYKAATRNFDDFRVDDLGQARRAWATESLFGIYGGKSDVRQVRQRIVHLRAQLKAAELDSEKEFLQARLGRLSGGTAILRTGGYTETEMDSRKEVARRAVTGLRLAIEDGVVPGGGVALLNCQACLKTLPAAHEDEVVAYRILRRALEEPIRTIAHNSGFSEDVIIDRLQSAPPGHGFDARQGKILDLREQGVQDAVHVLVKALEIAVSGAAMALTTDVIVHHRLPKESVEP